MALPSLTKTYEIDPNNAGGIATDVLQDHQRTMFALKEALIGSGEVTTAPMTVSRSSDGVSTAGAGDNWAAYTDIIWGTGDHSWIVLKSGGTIPFEICIAFGRATNRTYEVSGVWYSPSGIFTGGSVSAPATATDQVTLLADGADWCGNTTFSFTAKVQVMVSTDGNVIMACVFVGNVLVLMWRFDTLSDAITGWTDGVHIWFESSTGITIQLIAYTQLKVVKGKWVEQDGVLYPTLFSYEAFNVTEVAAHLSIVVANDFDSSYPMGTIGVWSLVEGARGKLGTLTDIWLVQTTGTALGDYFPDAPTFKQFVVFGNIALPWDSSTVIQTT